MIFFVVVVFLVLVSFAYTILVPTIMPRKVLKEGGLTAIISFVKFGTLLGRWESPGGLAKSQATEATDISQGHWESPCGPAKSWATEVTDIS